MLPICQFRNDFWMIWNKLFFQKQKTQKYQKICLQNLYNKCLKLESRPILYVYNLLGYGETHSEKSGKSQTISEKTKNTTVYRSLKEPVVRIWKHEPHHYTFTRTPKTQSPSRTYGAGNIHILESRHDNYCLIVLLS